MDNVTAETAEEQSLERYLEAVAQRLGLILRVREPRLIPHENHHLGYQAVIEDSEGYSAHRGQVQPTRVTALRSLAEDVPAIVAYLRQQANDIEALHHPQRHDSMTIEQQPLSDQTAGLAEGSRAMESAHSFQCSACEDTGHHKHPSHLSRVWCHDCERGQQFRKQMEEAAGRAQLRQQFVDENIKTVREVLERMLTRYGDEIVFRVVATGERWNASTMLAALHRGDPIALEYLRSVTGAAMETLAMRAEDMDP